VYRSQATKRILEIMHSNRDAASQVAALFDKHMPKLSMDVAKFVDDTLSQTRAPSLEELAGIVDGLKNDATDVRQMCCDTVRTGIYSCVAAAAGHLPHSSPLLPCPGPCSALRPHPTL